MSARIYTWPSLPPDGQLRCRECHCGPPVHVLSMLGGRLLCRCRVHGECASRALADVEEG